MTSTSSNVATIENTDSFYIGGEWVKPSSDATFEVRDSTTEEVFLTVPEAQADDLDRAISAARTAFDDGPWARLTHGERAEYLRALGAALTEKSAELADVTPRETGTLHRLSQYSTMGFQRHLDMYAGYADSYPWEEPAEPSHGGGYGLIVREPVGVVGAIIPWNGPLALISYKIAPGLLAGCTFVVKSSPEAPAASYFVAEAAEKTGLPPGVLNFVTADRPVSERLVTDPRVDKISFTGSTAAGRRIASLCGERIARVTLELGGKSAAVILDDADLGEAARILSAAECTLTGQVCSSLTRIVVSRSRHDDLVEALAADFSEKKVGDPFAPESDMGPLAMERQLDRVHGLIAKGVEEGATLATGGGRPQDLPRGYFVEPTVFGNVDNHSTIAQQEIFGPVLSVIPADDEQDAIRIANDSIYGLNSAVFTPDIARAREVSKELRAGTVGHNSFRTDFGIAFGGFKQSGLGREGGREGIHPFLEIKTVILDGPPPGYEEA